MTLHRFLPQSPFGRCQVKAAALKTFHIPILRSIVQPKISARIAKVTETTCPLKPYLSNPFLGAHPEQMLAANKKQEMCHI